jgi:epoxyqueuosine reductase QueG
MNYSEYRKKLRKLSAKYNEAYKRLGWGADITRKLRQQKTDLRAKYAVHSFDYAVETLTGKGIL